MTFTQDSYNEFAETYNESDFKPDKHYSILPTVLKLAGNLDGKTVLDLGCGDGFFAEELAKQGSAKVIGIDISEKQIEIAKQKQSSNVEYRVGDIFTEDLPKADVIISPFVLLYAQDVITVSDYVHKIFNSLNSGGRAVFVFDKPKGIDNSKFGARKKLREYKDGASMEIELYNQGKFICTLHGVYFKEETVRALLREAGFQNCISHTPVVSQEGQIKLGTVFWEGYTENSELGYVTAEKA